MVTIEHPASFWEARAMVEAQVGLKPHLRLAAVKQLVDGRSFGVRIDGRLMIVLGFYPLGDDVEELTLWSLPRDIVAPHTGTLYRAGRLIIARQLYARSMGLVARTAPGHLPGERLCRLLGFRPVAGADGGATDWIMAS